MSIQTFRLMVALGILLLFQRRRKLRQIQSGLVHARLCRNLKYHPYFRIVIPGLIRNPGFFNSLQYWMPDRVRHDNQIIGAFLIAT
jgi:hypothetical protein